MGNNLNGVVGAIHPTVTGFVSEYDNHNLGLVNRNLHRLVGTNEVQINSSAMTTSELNVVFQTHPYITNLIINIDDNWENIDPLYSYPYIIRRLTLLSDILVPHEAPRPDGRLVTLTQSIQILDITGLPIEHIPFISTMYSTMTPPMTKSKELRLPWYHLERLGEHTNWSSGVLDWVSTIHVTMEAGTVYPSEQCIKWLHNWAIEENQVRRLTWVIAVWSSDMSVALERAHRDMELKRGVLKRFHLIVRGTLDNIDDRGSEVFGLFAGESTSVIVSLWGHNFTTQTIIWMNFIKCFNRARSIVTNINFRCNEWNDEVRHMLSIFVCDYAWMVGEHIVRALNQNRIDRYSVIYDATSYNDCLALSEKTCRLHMTIRIPSTQMLTNTLLQAHRTTHPSFEVLILQQMIEQGNITLTLTPIFTNEQLADQRRTKSRRLEQPSDLQH